MTNAQLFDALRAKYATFKSLTAEVTADIFTEKGFGALATMPQGSDIINSFFSLSMRVAFNKLDIAKVNTRLEESGLVEVYGGQNGGYLQRISIESIAPISPGFVDLQDGSSVDPFIVRKPKSKERFFECGNFNYQSLITLQDYQVKTIFINETGMADFIAGIMAGLENGYKMQKEVNIYKAVHECINSTDAPMQDTQKITLASWTDADVTDAELLSFIASLQDLATAMTTSITQPGLNANKFDTAISPEDCVVLVRAGIANKIKRQLMVGAYNPDNLTIPFKIMEVADFGGVVNTASDGTELTPVYNNVGERTGWKKGSTNYTGEVKTLDKDANVLAVVAQKGLIFEEVKEPYSVRTIQNPRGLYDNYWASAPNNMIRYDANYACVTISKPQA